MNGRISHSHGFAALLALLVVLAACESATSATPAEEAAKSTTTVAVSNAAVVAEPAKSCPVTIPSGDFTPPRPYPADHPAKELVWFGSDGLWTALAVDGNHGPRKAAFWSDAFPGGEREERPPLEVTWTRLDGGKPSVIEAHDATNAYTVEEGWFMIGGIDPDEPGCWRVDAGYKGATLSYVYEM